MDVYKYEKIRNVAILGHGGCGKTTLVEAMAYVTGVINHQGRVEDGNTISDYDKVAGTVTIVTQQIGASSSEIISFEEGESFKDVVGPLGIPSDFTEMPEEELSTGIFTHQQAQGARRIISFRRLYSRSSE